jgi:hypothetical protein
VGVGGGDSTTGGSPPESVRAWIFERGFPVIDRWLLGVNRAVVEAVEFEVGSHTCG